VRDLKIAELDMSDRLKVLFIENNLGDSRLVQEMLAESRLLSFAFQRADSLTTGLFLLTKGDIDVILLDLSLPESLGLENLSRVRKQAPEVAVIIITSLDDEFGIKAIQAGAQDYLIKGHISSQLLIRTIRYAIERKRFEKRLEYLATHDGLTGLPNRMLFRDRLDHALERAKREYRSNNNTGHTSVMLLDVDNFKEINDTLGHAQGDNLLCLISDRLLNCLRKSDTAARMGGDEFTIISEEIDNPKDCAAIATKILHALSEPFALANKTVHITASLGISLFPLDGDDAETLLRYADQAMYLAKKERNGFRFHKLPIEELDEQRVG
jgi:two-component system, cell cycle response regulator